MKPITTVPTMESCRADFPALRTERNSKPPIYLDNACTTLVPRQVIDSINEYYSSYPACGGRRSHHWFANEVRDRIEGNDAGRIKGSRRLIAEFINASSPEEIIFTSNTTHSINLVALGFDFRPADVVLLSDREHNSNLIPWLRLQENGQIRVETTAANSDDGFDFDVFEQRLRAGGVRMVSLAYSSNLTGQTLPAREIIEIAHRYGARVLLDGAQTLPHQSVDVQTLDVDFLAFSLHKMCGPRGVGVLYARRELLTGKGSDRLAPVILGGGTVADSSYDSFSLLAAPESFESGIQNYPGQIAAGTAIEYLSDLGMDCIAAHELTLNRYLTDELMKRYGDTKWFRIIGPQDAAARGGILSFEVRRPNAVGIADELDRKSNIMIRDGVFCVHSYFNARYGQGWMRPKSHRDHRMIYRVSLYFYNTLEECRAFLLALDEVFQERCYV